MGKIIFGNLLEMAPKHFTAIVHGANCHSRMGSGFAKELRQNFPEAFTADKDFLISKPEDRLGKVSYVDLVDRGFTIYNAYTQLNYGYDGKRYVSYQAIQQSLTRVARIERSKKSTNPVIGYPMLGAGLGGGDWSIISTIIDECFEGLNHTLVLLPDMKD